MNLRRSPAKAKRQGNPRKNPRKVRVRFARALVPLGLALDVTVEERGGVRREISWSRPHWLATDTGKSTLYIYPVVKARKRNVDEGEAGVGELAKVFRLWMDFEPDELLETSVLVDRDGWDARGKVVRIGYRSDKWTGKRLDYEHDFKARPRLSRSGRLYRISGGVRVTPAGITG